MDLNITVMKVSSSYSELLFLSKNADKKQKEHLEEERKEKKEQKNKKIMKKGFLKRKTWK